MSTQANISSFVLNQSGFPFVVKNPTCQASGNLTVTYTVNGSPSSLSVYVEGIATPQTANTDWGDQGNSSTSVLDTYSGTTSTTRTIALSQLWDSFKVTAVWSGNTQANIAVLFSASGSGPVWSSSTLGTIQTYTGA